MKRGIFSINSIPVAQTGRTKFNPWVGKMPWGRKWQPPPALLPGGSHGQRSLAGYIHAEENMTEPRAWLLLREEFILISYLTQSLQNLLGPQFDVYIINMKMISERASALLCTAGL